VGLLRTDRLWPDATIPYEVVDPWTNWSFAAATQVALADWLAKSELQFIKRTNESNYVRLRLVPPSAKCHAGGVGNERRGAQTMECSVKDPGDWSIYAHELAHTIGFAHEHQRPDRDNHVQVEAEAAKNDPYDILGPPTWTVFGSYDCDSVSHYRTDDALKRRQNGCHRLGTTSGASAGDLATVRAAYGLTAAAGLIGPGSVLSRDPDSLDVFVRWTNNAIHTANWRGEWKGWWRVDPPTPDASDVISRIGIGMSPPTTLSRTPETIDVIQRQRDDSIVATTWTGSTWTRWRHLGGKGTSTVAAIPVDMLTSDVVVRGLDARVWHTTMRATSNGPDASTWGPIHDHLVTSDIGMVRTSAGTLHVVARGVDGTMVATRRPKGGTWSPWQSLDGITVRLGATPAIVARGNTVDLVVIDEHGRVRGTATHDDGATWKGWWTIGDLVAHPRAGMAMVARTPKHLDLVTVDQDLFVRHAHWDVNSPDWHAWEPVTDFRVARASGLALACRKPGQLDLFAIGMDGKTWTAWWVNPSWHGPRPVETE